MPADPELSAHLEWLGYIQPVGLVVSPPALLQAQAHINRNVIPQHQRFLSCLPTGDDEEPVPQIIDFPAFVHSVLDWQDSDLIPFEHAAEHGIDVTRLEVVLPEYNETLRPTWIVPEFQSSTAAADPAEPANADRIVMLITQVAVEQDLDEPPEESDRRWHASPHAKFERLLRESHVPAGLLTNGRNIRLVYAPRGETSGYLTFNVEEMTTVAGRPIFAALHMLLNSDRLFNLEKRQRLPAILAESRKYQNTVSTQLAQQVMAALYELLRGFQAADDQWNGRLLKNVLEHNPQHVYHGLLTVLMRTVFILYAEDRNLLSSHPVYTNFYSIIGLFERLRSDAGQYPDTMDQRYGAWAQLLTLFRMIYEGGRHDDLKIPPRKGYLFDPERYPFLEGRGMQLPEQNETPSSLATGSQQLATIPRVPDGVVYRVLNNLLMLDGERLSYRSLDVEQIGSVYEAIMGFEVKVSTGRSIAIKPVKKHGAPATINLEELLGQKAADRAKWLKERTDQDFKGQAADALKSATSIEDLLAALEKKIAGEVTPNVVPSGAMIFQPSDERRRSGSHYTPRSLTEPIVRTTLEPILAQLLEVSSELLQEEERLQNEIAAIEQKLTNAKRDNPTLRANHQQLITRLQQVHRDIERRRAAAKVGTPHPEQILQLKICDPAMGSGAFLVEVCRQLADALVKAWYAHWGKLSVDSSQSPQPATDNQQLATDNSQLATNNFPDIPPDEDEVLYARRLIAQRCLYGVDKNDMAVDLAKLSLWLVTLAKDHAFTFLDHSLRHGDALVGLTRDQIIGFHWEPKKQKQFGEDLIQKRLDRATEARAKILNAREDVPYRDQEQRLALANEALDVVRLTGDACVSAFFAGSKPREREARCEELRGHVEEWYRGGFDVKLRGPITEAVAGLRGSAAGSSLATGNQPRTTAPEHPLPPFHWEIEFPEVFSRENGGFDAFVGNPPFAGKNNISKATREGYIDWLKTIHPQSHGNSDLVAHFFRRSFQLVRLFGCFGLIATKTIREGDTRSTGLRYIALNGGSIYHARRRFKWPGQACVIVSVVHICKNREVSRKILDGEPVLEITAYLFHRGGSDDPHQLQENRNLSFVGSYVLGIGFTFDDEDDTGVANSIDDMKRLLEKDKRNRLCIFPYLNGLEVNKLTDFKPSRYIINFSDWPERRDESPQSWHSFTSTEQQALLKTGIVPADYPHAVASDFPDLYEIAKLKVKGTRASHSTAPWWQYERPRVELQAATWKLDRVLVRSLTSAQFCSFTFLPSGLVFDQTLIVFAFSTFDHFCILNSRTHECWGLFMGGSMGETPRYNPADCFEPFPRPHNYDESVLRNAGEAYFEIRKKLLQAYQDGLTKVMNRFHDPHEHSPEIQHLRDLHAAMDRAVLEAYGWHDLASTARCEFLLDYEEEDEEVGSSELSVGGKRGRKKPWRLRWPDDFRDEVLARLLELNEQRHKEEVLAGKAIVRGQGAGAGDQGDDDDADLEASDEETDSPKPKKTAAGSATKPKPPRKSKKSPAPGQQEMEF